MLRGDNAIQWMNKKLRSEYHIGIFITAKLAVYAKLVITKLKFQQLGRYIEDVKKYFCYHSNIEQTKVKELENYPISDENQIIFWLGYLCWKSKGKSKYEKFLHKSWMYCRVEVDEIEMHTCRKRGYIIIEGIERETTIHCLIWWRGRKY